MQKQDYAGLSRTFDAYFPHAKQLVEQTEIHHNKLFTQQEEQTYGFGISKVNLGQSRLIGTFEINNKDNDSVLPRLYFKKSAEGTNPYFYAITTPNLEILYVGSSLDDSKPKTTAASISAITGGVVPFTESKQLYIVYLGILSAIKRYGYCKVYEIKTGYENIEMVGMDGVCMPKKDLSKCFAADTSFFLMSSLKYVPVINHLIMQLDDNQKVRDDEIWDTVSTFKGMIRNGIVGKFEEKKQETAENQEITVEYRGDDITFRFKNKVSLMTDEECGIKKTNELEKFVPTSAKILCQTGDTVYDKYTSYIAHKMKEGGKVDEKTARRLIKLQSEFTSFERSIIDLGGGDKHIEYGNIYLGDLEHTVTSYRLFNDGSGSRITVNLGKSPTLTDISLIVCGIKDLFDLDAKTKVIFDI